MVISFSQDSLPERNRSLAGRSRLFLHSLLVFLFLVFGFVGSVGAQTPDPGPVPLIGTGGG